MKLAPLLRLSIAWRGEPPTLASMWGAFGWRYVAGALACAALFALTLLFNEARFGTPSIVGKVSASAGFITARNPRVAEQLCGPGRSLAPENRYADPGLGWRYINGPVRCTDTR
jgi:hypothetical protein